MVMGRQRADSLRVWFKEAASGVRRENVERRGGDGVVQER